MSQEIIATYRPTEKESYMNQRQLLYFKQKLLEQKTEFQEKALKIKARIKCFKTNPADLIDKSDFYMDMERNLSNYERYNQKLKLINGALQRMKTGQFGYCELTGSPIGLERLEILPYASMSVEALELFEMPGGFSQAFCYQPCA
ncbi:TraR/DksA family transcriptional regulator [Desulfocicer niacini]